MPAPIVVVPLVVKLFILLKQYLLIKPLANKGLRLLLREAKLAKRIERDRANAYKGKVPNATWYCYVTLRGLSEIVFYATLLHSLFGFHTCGMALLVCIEDWAAYWLTVLVPFWFANHWERVSGAAAVTPPRRTLDFMLHPLAKPATPPGD